MGKNPEDDYWLLFSNGLFQTKFVDFNGIISKYASSWEMQSFIMTGRVGNLATTKQYSFYVYINVSAKINNCLWQSLAKISNIDFLIQIDSNFH